jgi:alkylation response protein AidB-like acyl-CoA dehydrogenase
MEDVRVPAERVLVTRDGLSYGQAFLNLGRLQLPCWVLGRMRALFERTVENVSSRVRYGVPVADMQAAQAVLGRMVASFATARLVIVDALGRADTNEHEDYWDPAIALSKYVTVEQALTLARGAQAILGGDAAFEAPFERDIRDFNCFVANLGTQLVLEIDLGVLATAQVVTRRKD